MARDRPTAATRATGSRGGSSTRYTGDQAEADIDSLAQKYIGQSPYPWRSPGEQRISYLVEPTHVFGDGG